MNTVPSSLPVFFFLAVWLGVCLLMWLSLGPPGAWPEDLPGWIRIYG